MFLVTLNDGQRITTQSVTHRDDGALALHYDDGTYLVMAPGRWISYASAAEPQNVIEENDARPDVP